MLSSLIARLFVLCQHVLPQHGLSAVMYRLTRSDNPLWSRAFIRLFCRLYRVDLDEAIRTQPSDYRCFNDFFTRDLQPDARPIEPDRRIILSPADGAISQIGAIDEGEIFQAKGRRYDVKTLLGGVASRAAPFRNGRFATIYLSPKDYHRLHMPIRGRLTEMVYLPGRLFSVNEATTALVPSLFARNERVVTLFDTEAGPMALVLVGAIFVGSIETVWHGPITPRHGPRTAEEWSYGTSGPCIERGAEMGRFNMGSTVIALFGPGAIEWLPELGAAGAVRMGRGIGRLLEQASTSIA